MCKTEFNDDKVPMIGREEHWPQLNMFNLKGNVERGWLGDHRAPRCARTPSVDRDEHVAPVHRM